MRNLLHPYGSVKCFRFSGPYGLVAARGCGLSGRIKRSSPPRWSINSISNGSKLNPSSGQFEWSAFYKRRVFGNISRRRAHRHRSDGFKNFPASICCYPSCNPASPSVAHRGKGCPMYADHPSAPTRRSHDRSGRYRATWRPLATNLKRRSP